jgi:hypothetical protein
MTKIISARHLDGFVIELYFSDGTAGEYDLAPIVERDTILTRPLRDPEYFRSFFLELGALAWPNGLELSPEALHRALLEARRLQSLPQLARGA